VIVGSLPRQYVRLAGRAAARELRCIIGDTPESGSRLLYLWLACARGCADAPTPPPPRARAIESHDAAVKFSADRHDHSGHSCAVLAPRDMTDI
jgi:hypothetical protein